MSKTNSFNDACIATRLIFLAFGLGISSWAPMVPFVKSKLGANDAELGLILLIFGIGAIISMPIAGYLVHKWGSRSISFWAALMVVVTLPFLAVVNTVFHVSLVLFIFGMSTGAWNVSINAQAVTVESKSDIPIMSRFHSLFSIGGLFGALVISCLLELGFSLVFCTLIISCIIFLIIFWQWQKLLEDSKPQQPVQVKQVYSFPNTKVLFLGIICFISFMAEGSMLDWSAEFLRSSLHYDQTIASIGFAIFSMAMAFGRFFGDKIKQKIGTPLVLQLGSILAACGFLMIVFFGLIHLELLGFLLIGLGASNIVPILFSMTGRLVNSSSSYALTIVTSYGYVGMLIGPAFIGFIARATSLSFAFICIAFFLGLVGLSSRFILAPEMNPKSSINF